MRKFLLLMMAMIAGTTLSSAADETYELVTSTSALAAGDEVLIVYASGSTYYAMGGTPSGQTYYRSGSSVTVSNNTITLPSTNTTVSRFTLGSGSASGTWTFYSTTNTVGYLTRVSTSSWPTTYYLGTATSTSASNDVTMTISNSTTGAASLNFKAGTSTNRYLTYTTSNSRFNVASNSNSNTNIRIFKRKIVPEVPTFSLAAGEYKKAQKVTLSTTTEGATIYYTTDGTTPTESSTKYARAITVGEGTTTIKAIAVLKGVSSDVATATYTITIDRETFHLVTNANQLMLNDTLILVYSKNGKAMADQIGEGNRASSSVTIAGDSIAIEKENDDVARFCLGGGTSARTFRALNTTGGYLYNSGAEGYLNTQDAAGDYAKATIAIAANGDATITFHAEGSNKLLVYYLDPDAGPGGDDPTPPIVGAKPMFKAPVAGSTVMECFTLTSEINEEEGYHSVQIYKKKRDIKDINKDGQWTIADVTALVNIILGKDNEEPYQYDHDAADVNGDGNITIADVTALVNIILGK